jgi:hypothetical protein
MVEASLAKTFIGSIPLGGEKSYLPPQLRLLRLDAALRKSKRRLAREVA